MFSKLRASVLAVGQEVSALLSPPESVQVCLRIVGPRATFHCGPHFQTSAIFSRKLLLLWPCWQAHCKQSRWQDRVFSWECQWLLGFVGQGPAALLGMSGGSIITPFKLCQQAQYSGVELEGPKPGCDGPVAFFWPG